MIRVLFAGDIVGSRGCAFAKDCIRRLKNDKKIDIVIVNGENSADGNGITYAAYKELCTFADVITTGNHAFRRKEFYERFDELDRIVRPANFPDEVAGRGVYTIDMGSYSFTVVNIMGTAFMQALENPFFCIDRVLEGIGSRNILVDIHAEATSEKKALGFYLDGRVSAVVGTHTHVQTADEMLLPKSTAYITDVGMCGAEMSALGVCPELVIKKQKLGIPVQFREAEGKMLFGAVIVDINEKTGKAVNIDRIRIKEH